MSAPAENSRPTAPAPETVLEQGTYEVIRSRLATHGAELKSRLEKLNTARKAIFGAIDTTLLATERVTTRNKCVPRDMIAVGKNRFLFGYNVQIGLRSQTQVADVLALYEYRDGQFHELSIDSLGSSDFESDFKSVYQYFRGTTFLKFSMIGPHLFMVFQVGKTVDDIKVFKWLLRDERLEYLGNRSDHEFGFPPQREFEWVRTHRELHRSGLHPHISIEERVFVETIGGDLTIKVEDNTATGQGVYSEPVENADQTLDDAEIYYASLGNLILLKIRPYQERKFRHFVFNEKIQQVRRIDAIEDACVPLPENHGIIFSNGYYLQTGEAKTFETGLSGLRFDGRIQSPNGEDHLFRFYQPQNGVYLLFSYNIIEQNVETPLICGGCSLFENGQMALFKGEQEPQKHHVIQVWQTPYTADGYSLTPKGDSYLHKIGNPDLVSAMAECREVLALLQKEDTYANLYLDLVNRSGDVIDTYFWLGREETFDLKSPLSEIRAAATAALNEFEKVVSIRRNTAQQVRTAIDKAHELATSIPYSRLNEIGLFVQNLAALRVVRGELISLKDLRYADVPQIDAAEKEIAEHLQKLSTLAVEFLLTEGALDPYRTRVQGLLGTIKELIKVTDAQKIEAESNTLAKDLEMLIEVVSNLKIDDATQVTRIIENISAVYAVLNQSRAALKQKSKELRSHEAAAEFASQSRLLNQALTNYLDLCQSAPKCDEYLTKLLVQVEELEARFADFDEYVLQLTDKRTEISGAFESRKLELAEAHNRKTLNIVAAAERILKGVKHRADSLKTVDEIHGYFASDALVEKVRSFIQQLTDLGDSVKADDLQGRLKTIREDAIRQLKDRQELFVDGHNLIQFGEHRFSVNTQELDLTMVHREGRMFLHLAGTRFFEEVQDPEFLQTQPVWAQEVVSENAEVYRGEYLAYKTFLALRDAEQLEAAVQWPADETLKFVQDFMTSRYAEAYVKGVHDHDAANLLTALIQLHSKLGLLRYSSPARACASAFWHQLPKDARRDLLLGKLRGYGTMKQLFPSPGLQPAYIREVEVAISDFIAATHLFDIRLAGDAAEYLYHEIQHDRPFAISPEAAEIFTKFRGHLVARRFEDAFKAACAAVREDFPSTFALLRDWLSGFVAASGKPADGGYLDETALLLLKGDCPRTAVIPASPVQQVKPMLGNHAVIQSGAYELNYIRFTAKLRSFATQTVPLFERCQGLKKRLLQNHKEALRLDDFKPRVLTSFVRNRLINSVYLPLIGANLAKQIGAAGESKRTDLMGMLLLISPPGYGKTTLMEYLAHRLGIVFVKINGPSLGDKVVSLDPSTAPNGAAREEIEKLNLALEMGDNVMLYLDDIQHCNPEFLQKFISLCDAQRRIEGVYRGKSRTYDLRGRKIAVVMAGNPYTESGDRFQIPDMLANRADTYNLGDIIGGNIDAFKLSYLENAMTSNPVLSRVALRNPKDTEAIIRLAETGSHEGIDFEGTYAADELNQFVLVMRHLISIRETILKVNAEYIYSAAQAEAYRTEPPFKLQGSYRNMNRLAEKVLPVMTPQEVEVLVLQHYKDDAQTLTKGAEANLLKFKELVGALTPAEAQRWSEIKRTFKKNLLFHGADGRDPVGLVVGQLAAFNEGLESIKDVLAKPTPPTPRPVSVFLVPSATSSAAPPSVAASPTSPTPLEDGLREISISPETLKKIWDLVAQEPPKNESQPEKGTQP